jgi:hypothetical protein
MSAIPSKWTNAKGWRAIPTVSEVFCNLIGWIPYSGTEVCA